MKKLLLLSAALMVSVVSFAQFDNIGLLGGSTVTGWESDTDMVTTDGVVYTLNNVEINVPDNDPGVKFRKDDAWDMNWGGNAFPAGTASQNGPNIPATNGTYNVTFNRTTLQYSFVPVGVEYDDVSVMGGTTDIMMTTGDGVSYSADNVVFPEAESVAFMVNDESEGWGSASFPSGTAVAGGMIPVAANSYNIGFNLDTKAYNFNFVRVSLIGDGVVNWDTDTELATTDGVNYTLSNFTFAGGEGKFRLNNAWGLAWGSTDFPAGTGLTDPGAPNIPIEAGTFDVAFNRETGEYAFTEVTAGTKDFSAAVVSVYPNPAQSKWNFTAGSTIDSIEVLDITGKVVSAKAVNANEASIDASGLAAGMYFAKVQSGSAVKIIKVIKN